MKLNDFTKKQKRMLLIFMLVIILVLVILVIGIFKAVGKKQEEEMVPIPEVTPAEEIPQVEVTPKAEKNEMEQAIEEQMKELKMIKLHLEGYAKTIFAGWEWVMQEEISKYAKEQEIDVENAVILGYLGYDQKTEDHSFYIQLDDVAGTILIGKYHPYKASVEPTEKTLEEIQKEMEEMGDSGMPEDVEEEEKPESTPEPTKTPVVPYADMEIREVPETLVNTLGQDASDLPASLAGFLAANERSEDTYATYAENKKEEDGKTMFDLKLQDGTMVHVIYKKGEYTFSF